MKIDKTVLHIIMQARTMDAENLLASESRQSYRMNRFQQMLDSSTFNCNKPCVVGLFEAYTQEIIECLPLGTGFDWDSVREKLGALTARFAALDSRSHQRSNITYKPGTVVRMLFDHDQNNYGVGKLAIIAKAKVLESQSGKMIMIGLREDFTFGSGLYVYDSLRPHFIPALDEVSAVVAALPTEYDPLDKPHLFETLQNIFKEAENG